MSLLKNITASKMKLKLLMFLQQNIDELMRDEMQKRSQRKQDIAL